MAAEEKEPIYGPIKIHFDQPLGKGAYGEVYKASCGPLPCAAKLLHGVLLETIVNEENNVLQKFWDECSFLRKFKHPNIIQYLDTDIDGTTKRPVLLMELMDESLTRFLERSKKSKCPLAYDLQISICHDVSLALAFLHLNTIVHRDLSSNNVLLMMGKRVKVADFGVSRIINKKLTHLTICPGSKVYMPPEALVEPPKYSDKLDCFSFGVLSVQIATMNFPDPKGHCKVEEHPDYPTGRIQVFVPEVERRKEDIELIDANHPLLPVALNCLREEADNRPSAEDLCHELASIRSHLAHEDERSNGISCGTNTMAHSEESRRDQYTISGWSYEAAPDSFESNSCVALFDINKAYFLKQSKLYLYEAAENGGKWFELINTTYQYSGLAMLNNKLITVSGLKGMPFRQLRSLTVYANHVLSLNTTASKWEEEFPKIPTGRESPACVTTADHLIVLGGISHNNILSTNPLCVEVLDIKTSQWSTATNIPDLRSPQVVRCEDSLFLSNGCDDSFYRCEIDNLLKSVDGTSVMKKDAHSLWVKLQSIPSHQKATIFTFQNEVLAVGGESENGKDAKLIYRYNRDTNWWAAIGEIPTPRKLVLAGILSSDHIFCVGGQSEGNKELRVIEVAQIKIKA